MFSGQGSQYPGMGRALFESTPEFRRALEECDRILAPRLGTSLIELLYGHQPPGAPFPESTIYSHPALVVAILPYILLCVVIAFMGRGKKFGFWGNLFASMLLTPLVGLIVLLAQDNRPAPVSA